MTSPYRPEFEEALRLFARVSEAMVAAGHNRPVLVGGGAVEVYSNSAMVTGDFDIVTGWQKEFEVILREHGFERPSGPGKATRGWVHPRLALGFEVVSDTLLDGYADRARVQVIDAGADGSVTIIGIEDMIADRMGQFASGTAPEMREQAQRLFDLHRDADLDYMDRRIRHESAGRYGIADLRS